jgi:ribosomal protein L40E
MKFNGVLPEDEYALAFSYVKGKARTLVYNASKTASEKELSFDWLKRQLMQYFGTQDMEQLSLDKIDDLKQEARRQGSNIKVGPVNEAFIGAIANIADRTLKSNVNDYVRCLPPKISVDLTKDGKHLQYKSLQELMQAALDAERAHKKLATEKESAGASVSTGKRVGEGGSGGHQTLKKHKQQHKDQEGVVRLPKDLWADIDEAEKKRRMDAKVCLRCALPGHRATACDPKIAPNNEPMDPKYELKNQGKKFQGK